MIMSDEKADKMNILSKSIDDIENRIREQYTTLLDIDVILSDDPLIPSTKEMIDKIVLQELNKELNKRFKEILHGE